MRKIIIILALLFSTSIFCQEKAEQEVRETFEEYRQAILNDQGEKAIHFISENTFDYYDTVLKEVRTADSLRVENLPLIDKLMVLIIRHRTPTEKIKSFDKRSIVVYALDEGMIGKETVEKYSIGQVEFENENTAVGQLMVEKTPAPTRFRFIKEDNEWKVDLTALTSGTDIAFEKMIENSGMDENQFIFLILENLTGKRPDQNIWKPII